VKIANKWDLGFHLPTNKPNQGRGRRLGRWWHLAIAVEAVAQLVAANCRWPTVVVLGGTAEKGRLVRAVEGLGGHCGC